MKIGRWIEQLFVEEPDGPAVQYDGEWWTWSDMRDISDAIETLVQPTGMGPGDGVGIVLRERPHTYGAYLAALHADRCAVLVTPIQPDRLMADDVRALRLRVLIADTEDWKRSVLIEAAGAAGTMGVELTGDSEDPVRVVPGLEAPGDGDHYVATPNVAVTLLTSGTTGRPKRVPLTYDAFEGEPPTNLRPPWKRGVSINAVPLVSIGGATGVVRTVWRGRPTALMDRFDVLKWAELVQEHKPRHLGAPPATLRMLLDRRVPKEYLASGQVFSASSAPVDVETSDEFEERYGIPVIRSYGATEFLGIVTGFLPEEYHLAKVKRGSVGRAVPGCRVRIVDADTGAEVPRGKVGVLEADPSRRPLGTPPGWMRTNDLARMDEDGFVWIEGRADDVIIRGGFKVHSREVEAVLRQHPAVADAAVIGEPHPTLSFVPVAAVVIHKGATPPTEEELMDLVRATMPAYCVPTKIRNVDALPRNAMLKVVPNAVRELIAAD